MKKLLMFLFAIVFSSVTWGQNIFFDGFETGNTDQTAIAGWTQESVIGPDVWTANSSVITYSRAPHTGVFSAYLKYSNTRWLFKSVTLTGGTAYKLSFWSKQDIATGCNILASFGTVGTAAGMTTSIIPSSVVTATYQKFQGVFTPATNGTYYIGIRSDLTNGPWYVNIDDISLDIAVLPDASPTTFTATSITQLGMTIGWTDASTNETAFRVYRSTDNVTFTQVGSDIASTSTVGTGSAYSTPPLTGLLPGVTYYYRIAAVADFESPYLTGSQITSPAGEYVSNVASGNWSTAASWLKDGVAAVEAPTANDNVTIKDGHTITINTTSATCFNLTVGEGTSGVLNYLAATASTLTVNNSLTVTANGTFNAGTGSLTTHALYIGGSTNTATGAGNLVINGTFNMYGTAGVTVTFFGTSNSAVSGTGATLNFYRVVLNKGAVTATPSVTPPILDVQRAFTVQGANTVGLIYTHTAGVIKISGTFTQSNPLFTTASYSVPAIAGIWLNNSNFTVSATTGGSPTITGLFRVSSGIYNIGTASGNSLGSGTGSVYIIEGGTINVAGRFNLTSTGVNYNQSGGVITVQTVGNSTSSAAGFGISSPTGTTFTMSGGTIIIQLASTGFTPYDYYVNAATANVTGGTLQFGNASSGVAKNYALLGKTPNVILNTTSANHSLKLGANTFIYGDFTFNGTGTFSNNSYSLTLTGNSIANPGNVTMPVGSTLTINTSSTQTLTFNSSFGNQTFAVNGTFTGTSSIGQLPSIVLNNTFGGAGTVTIPGGLYIMGGATLTLTKGSLNVGSGIYLGTAAATGFNYFKGDGSITGTQNFNFGTGTVNYTYNGTTSQITGGEIPATIKGTLTINNSNGLTLGNPLTVGSLTLSAGKLYTTTANLLTISNSGTASTGSATAYIDGPMARSFAASRTASGTYSTATVFPLGKGGLYLPLWIDPTTNAGGSVVFKGEAFTSNSGSQGPGVNTLSTNRWEALLTSGNSNLTSSNIQFGDASILSANKILQSTAADGSYEAIVPIVNYTAGTPNILKTTGTQILAPVYYGYFAYGELTPCTAPSGKAVDLVTSNMTTTGFTGNFTAADDNPSNYLVVRYATGDSPTLIPADYTAYTAGAVLGNGTVVSANTTTSFNATGLTANTIYDFYVYSYNNSGCYGPVYYTDGYLMATVTTCAAVTVAPGTPTAASVTTNDFVANWAASSTPGVEYLLDVATNNTFTTFVSGYEAKNVGSLLTDNITGLTAATTYYVRVKAVITGCNSAYSGTLTVKTKCNTINSFPYTESFTATSDCWSASEAVAGASYHWTPTTSDASHGVTGPQSGSHFMALNVYSAAIANNPYYLYSPSFELGATSRQVKYYYYLGSAGYTTTPVPLALQISTDNGSTWTDIYAHTSANSTLSSTSALTGWYQNSIILGSYINQTVIFRFVSNSNYGSGYCNQAIDEFIIEDAPSFDAGVFAIVSPSAVICNGANQAVTFTVKNYSADVLDLSTKPITVSCEVTGTNPTIFTNQILNSGTLAAGATQDVTFSTTYNMTAGGTYTFTTATSMAGDGNAVNNSLVVARTVTAATALDYTEDFNAAASLPSGWVSDMTVSSSHGNTSTNGLFKNLYSSALTCYATAPKIGNLTANSVLKFDYRIVNYSTYAATTLGSGDNVVINISTDCGSSFTPLYTINSTTHVTSSSFVTKSFDLSAYAGQSIIVRFNGNWVAGDYYVEMDNFKVINVIAPTVTTTTATAITGNSATSGGNVTSDGNGTISAIGVCWSTNPNPTTADFHTTDASGTGSFASYLTPLNPNTKYYYKAYATNAIGTSYGVEYDFTTSNTFAPSVTTNPISSLTNTTVTLSGEITANGGDATISESGIVYSTSANPTIITGTKILTNPLISTGIYNLDVTALTAGQTYYFKAFATNNTGTGYGSELSFTTKTTPTVTTTAISNITTISATGGGNVTNDGGDAVTARGICWATTATPTLANSFTMDASGTGIFTSSMANLIANGQTYYVRAYATNAYGTTYGNQVSFVTACNANTLPYAETFEGAFPWSCWTNLNWDNSKYGSAHAGLKWAYSNTTNSKLTSPAIILPVGGSYKFSYWYKVESASYPQNMDVLLSTDGTNFTTTLNQHIGTTNGIYSKIEINLNAYAGQTVYLRFVGLSGTGGYDYGICVDDVSLIASQAGLWTGATNNDWATATNWDNGIVPNTSTNVTIPATATNFPTITPPATATINNLTIESNSSGTGSLLDNENLTINGTATVKQYVTGNKWHILSSPVQTATSNVFHLAAGQADIYIREYNAGAWSYITNLTTPLSVGKGYSIWADIGSPIVNKPNPTVSFTGQINTGNVTINMNPWTAPNTGWNFIGNPYTSAINWSLVPDKATLLKNAGAAYFWDQNLNANDGGYATHDGTISVNGATGIIPAMQGFLVQAANTSIVFTNATRVHNNQLIYKSSSSTLNDIVRIKAKRGNYSDETVVIMNSNATNNFDNSDALKMFANNNNVPEVYTVSNNNDLVINRFGTYPAAIPMNIRMGVSDNVTLTASEFANFDANVNITLEDILTGTTQDLRQNPSYTFAASIGENANRFVLHFATASGINEPNTGNISIYANNNNIYVNTTEKVKEISVYNMLGQVITTVSGNAKSLNTISMNNATGNYVVKVTTEKGVRTEKVFVK